MSWTEERDLRLLQLAADGYSYSQIADILGGVTRSACIGREWRIRERAAATGKPLAVIIPPENRRPARAQMTTAQRQEFVAAIRQAVEEGLTGPETAERTGKSLQTVHAYAAKNGIHFKQRGRRPRVRRTDSENAYRCKREKDRNALGGYVPRGGVRHADIVKRVAARSKQVRGCSCRPCKHLAEPGSMWCAEHERWAQSLRETAA